MVDWGEDDDSEIVIGKANFIFEAVEDLENGFDIVDLEFVFML
jgi:adenosine/AMP kinase